MTDGVARNERLTGTTAVVLLVLLAVEGVTILFIRPLLSWHIFVGMLLIPPVALYVRRGAPPFLLRALAPLVVAATVGSTGSSARLLRLTSAP